MKTDLRPSLQDILYSHDLLDDKNTWLLDDRAFRALYELVRFTAAGRVWTYTAPDDGHIPDDDGCLARITRCSPRVWKRVRPLLEPFFTIADGKWLLDRDWIKIGNGTVRPPISASLRSAILQRDNYRCAYCGETDGPFHCDHIIPVSRGGATTIENLITACAPCNQSKRDRTIEEWIRERTAGLVLSKADV